jgi:hypothetical protein
LIGIGIFFSEYTKISHNDRNRFLMQLRMIQKKGFRRWREGHANKKMNSTQWPCARPLTIASCTLSALVFDQLQSDGGELFMHYA